MKRSGPLCISLILILSMPSCAWIKKIFTHHKKEKTETKATPRLIGRVASVPPGGKFVLIQTYGKVKFEPGTILTTRGNDRRTANLRVTGESLAEFSAADIQSGKAEIGDAVYTVHAPQLAEKEPEAPAEKPAEIPKNPTPE